MVSVLKDVLAFYSIFPRSSPTKNDSKHTKRKKTQNKTEITEMTDTARPPPMSEIPPPVSASAALKMNSGGGPDDVVAVAALIDELKVRFDYSLIGFFFFPMMVLVF